MVEHTWEEFIQFSREGYEQVQRELKEVNMLIKQTAAEVDRFAQANSRAVARTRQIEGSFDTVPREDIRKAYTALVENQRRLFTMRGQLEKLQSDQKHLSRIADIYQRIMEYTAPGDVVTTDEETAEEEESYTPLTTVISVIRAQEEERLRLSREMHDGPAQSLTNLVLQAEICERLFERDPERAKVELEELKKNVVSTFQKVKTFIFDLRPMMLDDLGLVPTLKRYVNGLKETGVTGISIQVHGKDRRLNQYKEVTIFRVVQTLIHIARNQSQATEIKITLEMGEEEVRLHFESNGRGFELDQDLTSMDADRLGLPTQKNRIEALGGNIQFESAPGQGFNVRLTLPAPPDEE